MRPGVLSFCVRLWKNKKSLVLKVSGMDLHQSQANNWVKSYTARTLTSKCKRTSKITLLGILLSRVILMFPTNIKMEFEEFGILEFESCKMFLVFPQLATHHLLAEGLAFLDYLLYWQILACRCCRGPGRSTQDLWGPSTRDRVKLQKIHVLPSRT